MRVLLVRPPRIKQAITISDLMFSEPLGLEMVYGAIKQKNQVEIFDMMIEKESLTEKLKTYKPDIVGVTSLCIDVNMVISLTEECKIWDENILTFVGGTQSYLNPEAFFHKSIDYIFEYTTEFNIGKLLNQIDLGDSNPIDGVLSKKDNYKSSGIKGRNQSVLTTR